MALRVVLDTNVLVSALLWKGIPHDLLLKAFDREFQIIISEDIIHELVAVLKLEKFGLENGEVEDLLRMLSNLAEAVKVSFSSGIKLKHEGDQNVADCAVSGSADFIVTGDKELLALGSVKNIKIMTPKEFKKSIENFSQKA